MSFRDDFAKTPPGPKREELVYDAIIKEGKPNNLAPITVPGPQGTKITYYITRDFLNLDGVWLPMTGITAQKVADYFKMYLPTPKMSQQIYDAADTKIMPAPLSGTGYGQYSPQQVIQSKINASDAALAYSQKISDAQRQKGNKGIIAGHMKDLTQKPPSGNLGLYGWYGSNGKPVQNSYMTPHSIKDHTEYGAGVRLIDNHIKVEYPNGTIKNITMDQLMNSNLYTSISNTPGVARYTKPSDQKVNNQLAYHPPKPINGRVQLLQRINDFIDSLTKEV